jgi:uncharacterized protein YjbI with pentapeptide repeats
MGATLMNCDFVEAHLEGALMKGRDTFLSDVVLSNANCEGTDFSDATISDITFDDSKFGSASFTYGTLKTNLSGVDLTSATELTETQIEMAIRNARTKLPDYLQNNGQSDDSESLDR